VPEAQRLHTVRAKRQRQRLDVVCDFHSTGILEQIGFSTSRCSVEKRARNTRLIRYADHRERQIAFGRRLHREQQPAAPASSLASAASIRHGLVTGLR
jgi:hypothetical protein